MTSPEEETVDYYHNVVLFAHDIQPYTVNDQVFYGRLMSPNAFWGVVEDIYVIYSDTSSTKAEKGARINELLRSKRLSKRAVPGINIDATGIVHIADFTPYLSQTNEKEDQHATSHDRPASATD